MPVDRYRQATDAVYELYNSFRASGFDDADALELTKTYCHNSIMDSMLNQIKEDKRREARAALLRRQKEGENGHG